MIQTNLKLAHNTELLLRVSKLNINLSHVKNANIFYFSSVDGGSKQLQNKISFINYVLKNHNDIIQKDFKLKRKYFEIIAYTAFKLYDFDLSSRMYFRSWVLDISNINLFVKSIYSYSRKIFSF